MKKFEFFEIQQEEMISRDQPKTKSDLKMEEISPDQMYSIKGVLFLAAKIKKIEKNVLRREKLILKIINNVVVDEYRIFNKMIYSFQIKTRNERNYFISIGGDFDLHNIAGEQQYMMITSIKIFDATSIISTKYPMDKPDSLFEKNMLVKKINLLRSLNPDALYQSKDNKAIPKGIESFQNVLSFDISDDFTMCAVGLDKGKIILLTAKPNILDCPEDKIQMRFLSQKEDELHITNLAFSYIDYQGMKIDVLYATTTKAIYYYMFPTETTEEIKSLTQEYVDNGAYSGCIAVNANKLMVASNAETYIIEYDNLERGPSWFFEGRKQFIGYFKNYLMFAIFGDKTSTIAIYDRDNRFYVYHNTNFSRISALTCDEDNIYAFVESDVPTFKKQIITLKEKDNKEKFHTFYNKKFYDTAVEYAKSLKYDKQKISEINKRFAEHLYSKGDFKGSIEQFILTINYLDPSYVIQKFLEKKKLVYLIQYLEALDKDETFRTRDPDEIKDYTALLLNCYIMEERTNSLHTFFKDRNNSVQLVDIQTVIDICADTNQHTLALSIAEKTHKIDGCLDIIINKDGQKKVALDMIEKEPSLKTKFDLLCKYGKDLLSLKKELMRSLEFLIGSIIAYRNSKDNKDSKEKEKDIKNIKYEELLKIFLNEKDEEQLSSLIKFIIENDDNCPGTIIHRQIELYLEKLGIGLSSDEELKIKSKIQELIKNAKYKSRIDLSYIYILFCSKEQEEKEKRLQVYKQELEDKIQHLNNTKAEMKEIRKDNGHQLTENEQKEEDDNHKKQIAFAEAEYQKNITGNDLKTIFPEGTIDILELLEQRAELLSIYIETKNYENIMKECEKMSNNFIKGDYEKYLLWSLIGFVDKIIDNSTYDEIFPYVQRILDKMIEHNIPTLKPLQILKANKQIKFKSIRSFMHKTFEKQNKKIEDNKGDFEEKFAKLETAKTEIRDIKMKCVTFKPNKCALCTRQLSLPAVHFFCQHGYDLGCMNRDTINDMRTTGCGKCLNQNIIENRRPQDNAEAAKDYRKFKEMLDINHNKFDYTMSMLKEGMMVLGNPHYTPMSPIKGK